MSTTSAERLTVVELVQEALWPISGVKPPSSITSTTVLQEQKLRAITNDVCRKLRRLGRLPQQKSAHTFDLVSGQASYQLPKDFFRPVFETHWDTDQQLPLQGPLTDSAFRTREVRETGSTVTSYKISSYDRNPNSVGGQFYVYPTPAGGETLSFDYYSRHMFLPPYWLPSTVYAIGDYVQANGQIYLCDTNGTSGATAPVGTTDSQSDGTTQWDHFDDAYESVQSNSDLPIFDDEVMILGIRVGYLRGTGKDYGQEMAEWKDAISASANRWTGPSRGTMRSGGLTPRYQIPIRSWSL